MTEPEPTPPEQPEPTSGHVARAWQQARSAATKVRPDQVAEQFEAKTGAIVANVEDRLHGRRGGGLAVAALRQARVGMAWTIRSWHLVALELPSVVLLALAAYSVRVRVLGVKDVRSYAIEQLPLMVLVLAAVVTVVLTCNTLFAFALVRGRTGPAPLPHAWLETRARLGRVLIAALGLASAVTVLVWMGRLGGWLSFTASGIALMVVLSVGLASLPVLLTELPRRRRRRGEPAARRRNVEQRAVRSTSAALLTLPTVLVVELGRLLVRLPGLRWSGVLLVAAGSLLHTVAQSSVRAIRLTAKIATPDDPPPDDPGGTPEGVGDLSSPEAPPAADQPRS